MLNLQQLAAMATIMSALAAIASWLSARSSNQIAQRAMMPILTGRFDSTSDSVVIKNNGQGPALNLRIQLNSLHYTDIGAIYEFSTKEGSLASIMPGKESKLTLRLANTKDKREASDINPVFAAMEYYFNMGTKKYVALVFKDIHGKEYLARLRAADGPDYPLDLIQTTRYRMIDKTWDRITVLWFRSKPQKWWREFQEWRNEQKKETNKVK